MHQATNILQPPLWTTLVKDSLVIYSAHWDIRHLHDMRPPFVRILAYSLDVSRVTETLKTEFQCRFFFRNDSKALVPGKIVRHKKADRSHNAFFILCPANEVVIQGMQESTNFIPESVTVLCKSCYSGAKYEVCRLHIHASFINQRLRLSQLFCCTINYRPLHYQSMGSGFYKISVGIPV